MTKDEVIALMKQCGFILTDVPPDPYVEAMQKFANRIPKESLESNESAYQRGYLDGLARNDTKANLRIAELELQLKAYRARIDYMVKRTALDQLPDDN